MTQNARCSTDNSIITSMRLQIPIIVPGRRSEKSDHFPGALNWQLMSTEPVTYTANHVEVKALLRLAGVGNDKLLERIMNKRYGDFVEVGSNGKKTLSKTN